MFKLSRLLMAGLSFAAMMGAVGPVSAESLADAISMAYANNPTLQRARAQQRATDETYVQARAGLGPTVDASASTDYTDYDQDFVGTRSTTALNLSANQTLFASGGLSASVKAAEADVRSGREDLRAVEAQVLSDVISVYTAVRRDQEALRIGKENYDVLKRQLDETQARFDVGELTRTDVAQSQARLAASSASLARAQAQLDVSRAQYVAIVGQAPVALDAPPPLPNLPATFDLALDRAEGNNPQLNAAKWAEAAARARVSLAKSGLGPRVTLGAGYGASAPTDDFKNLDSRDAATATLRFTVPLFSAGYNSSRVRQAAEGHNAQKITVELARRSVVQDVSSTWANMTAARSATLANQEQVRAAQVAAEGVKYEQQVGLRTNIEVLNAEQELRSAQLALIDAQRAEYVAASQLLGVMGDLNATTLTPGVEAYDPVKNFDSVKRKGFTPFEPVIRVLDGTADSSGEIVTTRRQ
ncbi:TolC family outer membrane protein [Asticcacaulis sp. BYS171W]|uniref:TolC family outer membrane protein n=1 Tax=Asticcacaulis aquaticus TaxID=2984212 RepID=A0ABT5HW63_9CAUL|nr:TolC family outer membrane protein [Asticcacaulis aquaticus]MDC7684310.1 TolC family outer membrane protein [Asticcacaulis aquaticus]